MGALDPILGPLLVGTSANAILYGIMILQCHLYFLWHKHDKRRIEVIVMILLLLDTVSCAFDIAMTYNYLVTNFGNFEAISVINLYLRPYPVMTGTTAFVVQCFYGWRIHVLTRSRFLSILTYICSSIQFLASIGTTIGGTILKQFVLLDKVNQISLIWLVGSLVTDVIISATLVCYLRRNKTGFAGTDDLITRLNRMAIQTVLITTSFAIAIIIAFFASRNSTIHIAIGLPLSKLYTNSLLSALNARQGWTRSGNTADVLYSLKPGTRNSFASRVITDSSNTVVDRGDIEMQLSRGPPKTLRGSISSGKQVKILVENTTESDTNYFVH